MKKLILLSVLLAGCSSTPYVKVGLGYKTHESEQKTNSEHKRISCNVELGLDYGDMSYGYRHTSQCFDGSPFNDESEYTRDELFVDYKYTF